MDEFDIYLESIGSMETYRQSEMACFRHVFADPLELGDWREALAEIIVPASIKVVPIKQHFVCTPETPDHNSPSTGNTSSGGVMVERED